MMLNCENLPCNNGSNRWLYYHTVHIQGIKQSIKYWYFCMQLRTHLLLYPCSVLETPLLSCRFHELAQRSLQWKTVKWQQQLGQRLEVWLEGSKKTKKCKGNLKMITLRLKMHSLALKWQILSNYIKLDKRTGCKEQFDWNYTTSSQSKTNLDDNGPLHPSHTE